MEISKEGIHIILVWEQVHDSGAYRRFSFFDNSTACEQTRESGAVYKSPRFLFLYARSTICVEKIKGVVSMLQVVFWFGNRSLLPKNLVKNAH